MGHVATALERLTSCGGNALAEALPASALMFVAVAGPLFPYIALVQYGHATAVIMLVGLALQCLAALVATVRTVIGKRSAT